jgi:hypothetical protein
MTSRRPTILVLALVVFVGPHVSGCSRTGGTSSSPAAAIEAIRGFKASDATTLRRVNEIAVRHRGSPAELQALFTDPSAEVKWAAIYVASLWARQAADIAPLVPLLQDPDERVRAMVAWSLAGLGHAESRAVLESLRVSRAVMPHSDPPLTVGAFAGSALSRMK